MRSLLDLPFISRVRRNHALEHATMHVLSERILHLRLVGRSSLWGFCLYGDVPTETVIAAAQEGLRRLKAGQYRFAVHPNCGSNLAIAGTLAGLGTFLALGEGTTDRAKSRWERLSRLPLAFVAATVGIVLAQPLGRFVQAHVTTQPHVGNLRIASVTQERRAGILVHQIHTAG